MALKDLFKRQPGGTMLGNAIRGVVKTYTGGLLGNGALMISPEEAAIRDAGGKVNLLTDKAAEQIGGAAAGLQGAVAKQSLMDKIQSGGVSLIVMVVGGIAAVFGLVWGLARVIRGSKK